MEPATVFPWKESFCCWLLKHPQQIYLLLDIKSNDNNNKKNHKYNNKKETPKLHFLQFWSRSYDEAQLSTQKLVFPWWYPLITWALGILTCSQRTYHFTYLSWMREARSCWLMWELLHPFSKERTRIIGKILNIHEIPMQDILSSFRKPLSCPMFLKSIWKQTRKCWNHHTLQNFTNGACTITDYCAYDTGL